WLARLQRFETRQFFPITFHQLADAAQNPGTLGNGGRAPPRRRTPSRADREVDLFGTAVGGPRNFIATRRIQHRNGVRCLDRLPVDESRFLFHCTYSLVARGGASLIGRCRCADAWHS